MTPIQKVSDEILADDAKLPGTTQGDLIGHDGTVHDRLAVGADGQVLTADSAQTLGFAWKDPSAAANQRHVGEYVFSAKSTPDPGFLVCAGQEVSRTTYAGLAAIYAAEGYPWGAGDGSTTFNLPEVGSRLLCCLSGTADGRVEFTSYDVPNDEAIVDEQYGRTLETGMRVRFNAADPPIGLTDGSYYYLRITSKGSPNWRMTLHTTLASAVDGGSPVPIGAVYSGTQAFTYELTERLVGQSGGAETHALTIAEMPAHTHTEEGGQASGMYKGTAPGWSTTTKTSSSTGGSTAHSIMPPYVPLCYVWVWTGVE